VRIGCWLDAGAAETRKGWLVNVSSSAAALIARYDVAHGKRQHMCYGCNDRVHTLRNSYSGLSKATFGTSVSARSRLLIIRLISLQPLRPTPDRRTPNLSLPIVKRSNQPPHNLSSVPYNVILLELHSYKV
jgi:hypothetical protein